ncbi:hypothetical protein T459_22910 [Capsicum annuum]|uniref:DEAD/DEAH-box helicase domain-containing protein n=1 Tax=Capsicum annuum TaxID=4072 RepID=A0A2G2YR26_CAPAN|nr:hypothetical protein T459_22910 [Capsicum annuum]
MQYEKAVALVMLILLPPISSGALRTSLKPPPIIKGLGDSPLMELANSVSLSEVVRFVVAAGVVSEVVRFIVAAGVVKLRREKAVQHEFIPQAILGMNVICQANSGMGKTAVFVLSTLQQIEPVAG